MTPFPGVLVRRDVALRLGGFDENWGPVADYEFWYRLGCAGKVEVVSSRWGLLPRGPRPVDGECLGRMLKLTHLLRLKIAAEQFPENPRASRWLARFFTSRNARCYAQRFEDADAPSSLPIAWPHPASQGAKSVGMNHWPRSSDLTRPLLP